MYFEMSGRNLKTQHELWQICHISESLGSRIMAIMYAVNLTCHILSTWDLALSSNARHSIDTSHECDSRTMVDGIVLTSS